MLKLKDVMSTDITTISPRATLRQAAALLAQHNVSGVPVTSDGDIVGILSASDILAFAASEGDSVPELMALVGEDVGEGRAPAARVLDEHVVEEAMTRKLWALDAEADVTLAARLMAQNHIHRVVVTANGRPAGIVTTSDITRALGQGATR